MKRAAFAALSVLLSYPSSAAQEAPTQILVAGLRAGTTVPGGLLLLKTGAASPFQAIPASLSFTQNPASLALDGVDPTMVYVGTYGRAANGDPGPCHVLALRIANDKIVSYQQLNAEPMSEDYVSTVIPIGNEVYYLGRRTIGSVPKGGGPVSKLIELPDWMDPRGMASDGRFLYAAVGPRYIVKIDLARPTVIQSFARLKQYASEQIQNVAIDNAGDLLVVTSDLTLQARLLLLDHASGQVLKQIRLPLFGARAVAQDPDTDTIYIVGGRDANGSSTSAVTVDYWKVSKGPVGNIPNALPSLIVMKPRNIYRKGAACTDIDGRYAKIGSSGRASSQRSGFALTLDTKPNRQAVFSLGIERSGFKAFDLAFLGAPGCLIGVEPFLLRLTRTDSAGHASITFGRPTALSLHAVVLNAQWLVDAPGVNALGIMTSATARIVVRD
jgi:hypothetical protein